MSYLRLKVKLCNLDLLISFYIKILFDISFFKEPNHSFTCANLSHMYNQVSSLKIKNNKNNSSTTYLAQFSCNVCIEEKTIGGKYNTVCPRSSDPFYVVTIL